MRKWFILFIISILPYTAFADAVQIGSLWYNLDESTMTAEVISSGGDTYTGDIVIPSTVPYNEVTYSVTSISERAFESCSGVTSVVIQEGVKTIGLCAFMSCNTLARVELPSTIESIEAWAFSFTFELQDVISKIVTPFDIEKSVFCKNHSGEGSSEIFTPSDATLYVPEGKTSAYQAFGGWTMFEDVLEGELGEGSDGTFNYTFATVSKVATLVKGDYSSMESVTIPATANIGGVEYSVKHIGKEAFWDCRMETLIISSGVESIGRNAFQSCWRINSIQLPASLKTIGDRAFSYNEQLKSLVIPEGVIFIGEGAFQSHYNLQKLVLPSTLAQIGNYAFSNCSSLSSVISRIQHPFKISESVFSLEERWDYTGSESKQIFTPSSAILYVLDGTKASYDSTEGWKGMFADILEGELKETTKDGLIYSYLDGKGIATVIGRADNEMYNITIPGSVTIDGANYIVKSVGAGAFQSCSLETLVIGEGVETIQRNAFRWNYSLRSLTMPSTLKTIGENAFNDCENLKKIELPASLDSIGNYAFYSLNSLSYVVSHIQNPFKINESVFAINDRWDYSGSESKQIFTPSSATLYVPDGTKTSYDSTEGWKGMFADIIEGELKETTIDGLTYSYLDGKGNATVIGRADDDLRIIKIPGSIPINGVNYTVKAIGTGAFQNCGIDSLEIGEGVEIIGKNAFRENWSIRSVVLPNTLRTIGEYAFFYCEYQLSKIELPASLDSIGNYAFSRCNYLNSVTSRIQSPFAISQSVFGSESGSEWDPSSQQYISTYTPSNANLYVPEGTLSEYQKYAGWKMFAGIYEGEIKEYESDSLKYAYLMSSQTATVIASDKYRSYSAITIPATVTIDGVVYRVTEIGASAFRECYSLYNITINDGVEKIGSSAFVWCSNADFGTLPSSLKTIGESAFYGCRFTKLELPEGLKVIERHAFAQCSNMMKVTIPSTVTSIGYSAFSGTSSLSAVVSRIQSPFEIDKDVFGSQTWDSETQQYVYTCAADLYVPEGTIQQYKNTEGWDVFLNIYEGELKEITYLDLTYTYNTSSKIATVVKGENYDELKIVSIPSKIPVEGTEYPVKAIAGRAFSSTTITSVEIADGLETIGQEAFSNCEQLAKLSLPSTLVTIENSAFNNCRRLAGITIPASVKTIGNNALSGCYNLETIEVADGNETYESLGSNVIIERKTKTLLLGCKNSAIPNGVLAIGASAFNNCQIVKIQFPESVKSIGNYAFASCRYLTEVILPEGLDSIASSAFSSCERLETIEFPSTMKSFGEWIVAGCNNLQNVVSNIEEPKEIRESVFGDNYNLYSRATLWVPKGKIDSYKRTSGWNNFNSYDELLHDILTKPTIKYDGHHLVMTNDPEQRAKIYYSTDGAEPTILYSDTVALSNLGVIQAISKRYGSYTVDTARYEVTYVYDGVTARTATGGLLKNAFEWCSTDKIEMLDIDGQLNDDDFATIRGLSKLTVLNMAASKIENSTIPSEAFANMKLEWYVSPYNFTSVGSGIFKGCDKLAALTWNSSSIELPEDVVTDVANPNMLVYAKVQAMIPYTMKNVIVNGVANNIVLVDSAGNNNFRCPEEFLARRITYTHNYQQETKQGQTQGWETLALPFTVSKITHETKGEITPFGVEGAERPFWLYELGGNGLEKATEIRANIPYLICMPNDDAYGDDYMLGGRVTFSATNVTITTSGGTTVSRGDRQFVPTYQRVASSSDVYALNVNEVVGDNPVGSVFVQSLREVRPFEAYSVHSTNRARIITVSSLGGGDATGINDLMQNNSGESADGVVKVYSLSGALIKQGKREEVLRSLPNGLYIINGKKIIK